MLESKWPSGDLTHGQVLWNKLRNVLLAVHKLKKLGKDKNGEFKASIRAQQQQMQQQMESQQKQDTEFISNHNEHQHSGSKSELDNLSRSSDESRLSHLSTDNDEQQNRKALENKNSENANQVPTHPNDCSIQKENSNEDSKGEEKFQTKICDTHKPQDQEGGDMEDVFLPKNKVQNGQSQQSNQKDDSLEAKRDAPDEENNREFRKRASTIVKTSTSTLQGIEQGKNWGKFYRVAPYCKELHVSNYCSIFPRLF